MTAPFNNASNKFALGLIACIALTVLVSGCASPAGQSALFGGALVREANQTSKNRDPNHVRTLADLDETVVIIEKQTLQSTPVERVLASYREALTLFTTQEQRQQALRRMADLTMVASEDRFVSDDPNLESQKPLVTADDIGNVSEADELINYPEAIKLYQQLIDSPLATTNLAEVHYLLAKAYDLNTDLEASLATLDQLVKNYPYSPFHFEAQFRRGEILFDQGEYELANIAYGDVIDAEPRTEFHEHALYKRGWTHYKLVEYTTAATDFIALLDILNDHNDQSKKALVSIKEDAYRATSMSFANMQGPLTAREFFADNGERSYENELYRSLGALYIRREQFLDAAETYQSFVAENPQHPEAPLFTASLVEIYKQGNFPSLVVPAKEEYVFNYGVNSSYWENATDEQRTLYQPALKLNLIELAQHYHALAQASQKPGDYQKAAVWYRNFLETFKTDIDAPVMHNLLAETLFSAKDYLAAAAEFETTAYGYPLYEEADKAGYFALVAYQEFLAGFAGSTEQKSVWIKRRIKSSDDFVYAFPKHPKNPQIIDTVREDYLILDELSNAVIASQSLLKLDPPAPADIREKAWRTIADGEYDLKSYLAAEYAIREVLKFETISGIERSTYRERLAVAIYKQAEQYRSQGLLNEAANEFLRVGQTVENASVRANADFDAGAIYMDLSNWAKAASIFESFRRAYPSNPLASQVPFKLALAYEKTGQLNLAANELEKVARLGATDNPEMARQATWQAAELQASINNDAQAIKMYKQYVYNFPQPFEQNAEAQFLLVGLYAKAGDSSKRSFWLNKLLAHHKNGGPANTPRTQYLAAFSSYELAQPAYEKFISIPIKLPLEQSLGRKRAAMEVALERFTSTADLGVSEFLTASTFKIGDIYQILAQDLMNSERPNGLSELELEQYEILLEEQALPFEDQAIELFETNTERVLDDFYDNWVKDSFRALSKLLPGRYAKPEQFDSAIDIIY